MSIQTRYILTGSSHLRALGRWLMGEIAALSQDSSLKPVESLDCNNSLGVSNSLEKSAAENWICGKLSYLKSENNSFHTSNYNLMHVQAMHSKGFQLTHYYLCAHNIKFYRSSIFVIHQPILTKLHRSRALQ